MEFLIKRLDLAHLLELFDYRELVRNLVARDLKVRYRDSALGFLWCLLNPLMMMLVYTLVFTVLMKSNIANFPAFILVGILAWNLHASAVMGASASIIRNSHLVMKVYFPREALPISIVLSNTVNYLLALIALFGVILAFGIPVGFSLALLPVVLITQLIFTLGLAFFAAAITVFFRDVEIILETMMMAWFFLTPIFYRIEDLVPAYSRLMYILNPMASIIAAYRDILYSGGMPAMDFLGRTFVQSLVILIAGYTFFRTTSRRFAEEL